MDRQNILELEANGAATPLATVRAWNALALGTIGTVALAHEPARALALVHTCMYNAWAAYDDNARQTAHGVAVRLPRAERDAASQAAAMGHAAHAVLAGLDARSGTDDGLFTPKGIGRMQAAALLDVRHRDQPFALMPAEVRPAAAARPLAFVAVWCDVAQRVSVRDGHDDDRDVLLFFVLANALADADDAARDGVCAAFAAAEALRRFTGSDILDDATFTDLAAQAGPGPGQDMGRKVGARVFDKARRYWQGDM
ncbi:hypothetical protein ACL58G_06870 [Massilia sp. GER05]|uniref:hypothetical protein n=1 Tax=Massilia sp. GER05 TaxID=3394605 RepID=UPI003F843085